MSKASCTTARPLSTAPLASEPSISALPKNPPNAQQWRLSGRPPDRYQLSHRGEHHTEDYFAALIPYLIGEMGEGGEFVYIYDDERQAGRRRQGSLLKTEDWELSLERDGICGPDGATGALPAHRVHV
ncbi:unnamed protein product [Heligmosomoides polygyrus]|uniref:Uncharacterized protein n=1 Tax=Heligmosomoides polygyrus TaxID=6339 RepID=A0A183FGG9_HELPZ|nr:unnamed protein product [Heligmosomoides polygyrus]